ncbi:MAG: hypothetical protein OXF41_11055 [bacterium]|nr:hypothetical protein [bacterium]
MQSIEGEFWQDRARIAFRMAWEGESHGSLAYVFSLGDPGDHPHTRKNVPVDISDEEFLAAQQRVLMDSHGARFKPFETEEDTPSQWREPLPILDVATVARHAGVTEGAVRVACKRGALRSLRLEGYGRAIFVRLSDCETYYGAWDSEKSDRIRAEMWEPPRLVTISDDVAYLLPSQGIA